MKLVPTFEEYTNDQDLISNTLKMIKDQIGLDLKLDDHFSGIQYHKGKKYFNVILDEKNSESEQYNKLERFSKKYGLIDVEPNGVKRVSIFIKGNIKQSK